MEEEEEDVVEMQEKKENEMGTHEVRVKTAARESGQDFNTVIILLSNSASVSCFQCPIPT